MLRAFFSSVLLLGALSLPMFADPIDLDLYQGNPPGAPLSPDAEVIVQKEGDPIVRVTHVQKPNIRVFLPPKEKATGAACVICPGGAYRILAIDHEGYQVAQKLNEFGVAGIVLKYRVSDKVGEAYQHPVPLLDARQAMRLVRQHAAEWGIDPKRVGVMGFSAGGHLASTVDTLFNVPLAGEEPAVFAKMEHKPDFGVLVYPVITMTQDWGHAGSKGFLLGKEPSKELCLQLSTDLQVTAQTPPTFLVATQDDTGVPARNAISFFNFLTAHKVPAELHIWEKGGHGFGILPKSGDVAIEWPQRLEKWMRGRGLLGGK